MSEFQVRLGAKIHRVDWSSGHTLIAIGIAPNVFPSLGSLAHTGTPSHRVSAARSQGHAAVSAAHTAISAAIRNCTLRASPTNAHCQPAGSATRVGRLYSELFFIQCESASLASR